MERLFENDVLVAHAKCTDVTPMEIEGKNKKRKISESRKLFYKLRYDMHGESFTSIGRETDRCYSTVKRGIESANDLLSYDEKFIEKWNKVKVIPGSCLPKKLHKPPSSKDS